MPAPLPEPGPDERGAVQGFFQGDNVWVLIPLAALSIPIIAVAGDGPIAWFVGAVILVAALTAAARYLLVLRHRLTLAELVEQRRLALAERDRLDAIDRMVDESRRPPSTPRAGEPAAVEGDPERRDP